MKVRWVEVDRVRPYFRNPRRRSELSVRKITASIEEFGWQR
jgi:ParB-like chromosome segregation protein Spo0J